MHKPSFLLSTLLTSIALPLKSAFAHIGHVGEVAGHSHIIVIGATIAAAALAGLVAKSTKDKVTSSADADQVDETSEQATASDAA